MSPAQQLIIWGSAVSVPLAINLATGQKRDAIGLSVLVIAIWAVSAVLAKFLPLIVCLTLHAVQDSMFGAVAFASWQRSRQDAWKLALTFVMVLQCVLVVALLLAWPDPAALLFYLPANNSLLTLELICLSWGGVAHVWRATLDRMLGSPGLVHHGRPGS